MPNTLVNGSGRFSLYQAFTYATLILILMTCHVAEAKGKRKWNTTPINPWECNQEFSDLQSKWLQSPIVIRGDWKASDELTPLVSHKYNITITVKRSFKASKTDLKLQSKILVGEFSTAVTAKNKQQQRKQCLSNLKLRHSGYLFFLRPTRTANFFKITFLPVTNTKKHRNKIRKMQCKENTKCRNPASICVRAPEISRVHRKIRVNRRRETVRMRITCKTEGRPPPVIYWLKDGVSITDETHPDIQAVFRRKGDQLIGRLKFAKVTENHAGNYTCFSKNVQGSDNSSVAIHVNEIIMTQTPTTTVNPHAYLCRTGNASHCLNGGTCTIHIISKQETCICAPHYSGKRCEIGDWYVMLQNVIENGGYIRNLATSGGTFLKSDNLPILLCLIFLIVVVVFTALIMCFCLHNIRRRLDLENWKRIRTDRQRHQSIQVNQAIKPVANNVRLPEQKVATRDMAVQAITEKEANHVVRDVSMTATLPASNHKPNPPFGQRPDRDDIPTRLEKPLIHGNPLGLVTSPPTANGPTYYSNYPVAPRSRNPSGSQPLYGKASNNPHVFQAEIKPVFDYNRTSESDDIDSSRLWQELTRLQDPNTYPSKPIMMDTNVDGIPVAPPMRQQSLPQRTPSAFTQAYPTHPRNHRDFYRRSQSRSPTEHDNLINYFENPSFSNRSTPARRPYLFPGHGPPHQQSPAGHNNYSLGPLRNHQGRNESPAAMHLLARDMNDHAIAHPL